MSTNIVLESFMAERPNLKKLSHKLTFDLSKTCPKGDQTYANTFMEDERITNTLQVFNIYNVFDHQNSAKSTQTALNNPEKILLR
jgi:hypothetical protein